VVLLVSYHVDYYHMTNSVVLTRKWVQHSDMFVGHAEFQWVLSGEIELNFTIVTVNDGIASVTLYHTYILQVPCHVMATHLFSSYFTCLSSAVSPEPRALGRASGVPPVNKHRYILV